jgi:formate dehydrogenase subunit gamma
VSWVTRAGPGCGLECQWATREIVSLALGFGGKLNNGADTRAHKADPYGRSEPHPGRGQVLRYTGPERKDQTYRSRNTSLPSREGARGPARSPGAASARPARTPEAAVPVGPAKAEELFSREIPRFRRSERALHWAIAIPFLVCLASGAAVKLFFNRLHSGILMHSALLWVHRVSGVLLIVLPVWVAWRHRKELSLYLYNIKRAWSWTTDDLKWLALIGLASLSKRIALPEQHKFNAGEKINFMTLMLTYPVLVLTGAFLLTPGIHFLSFIAHVGVAVLAAPLILGHLFMALVNPDTRLGLSGMFSGKVDREWARHHYAKWYRENFHEDEKPRAASVDVPPVAPVRGVIRCSSCGTENPLLSWEPLLATVSELHPLKCPRCGAPSALVEAFVKADEIETILEDLERADVSGPDRRLSLEEGGAPEAPPKERVVPTFHPYLKAT